MAKKKKKSPKKEKKKEGKTQEKSKVGEFRVEVSKTVSNVKDFIKHFKSDVEKKKRAFSNYAQKIQGKK